MNSFLNHGQTPGNAWKGGEGEEELVGGNEKKGRMAEEARERAWTRSCLLVGMKGEVQRRRRKKKQLKAASIDERAKKISQRNLLFIL